ncbi:MAG: terminase gpA endonuclease subunit [Pseudoruegeria sp.]
MPISILGCWFEVKHFVPEFEPLPSYADPREALKLTLPSLKPAEEISVTEAAENYMRVNVGGQWQEFRRDVTPYMIEPSDMIASRKYKALAFCGPSQSGKTQMLQTALAYTIMCDPGRVGLYQMTQADAGAFESEKIEPMVRNSPALQGRRGVGRGANNIYQKLFTGGTHLTLDWPVISKLSSRTLRLALATDYDHFPENVSGEGDPFTLMRARTRTYMSRGMTVVESSPGAPLEDENFKPKTPHDCPPVKYGVLSIYPSGTRGRWYWPCPNCGSMFEPTFKRLRYPQSLDPVEAGEAAQMQCPHCEDMFGHSLKRDLNAAGQWLHETREGSDRKTASIESGDVRRTEILSYWLDGAAAAFSSWKELVAQYREAEIAFELTGDEKGLITALNTGHAQPYLPRSAAVDGEVTLQGLIEKSAGVDIPKGIAPAWTRYITVSIDTQGTFWSVGATAWGMNGRHQPIDRFEISKPPAGSPGDAEGRTVKPGLHAEDWDALNALEEKVWQIDGADHGLKAAVLVVDMQGGDATTENAYRFYRGRRRAGRGSRWYISRGIPGQPVDRVWLKSPERRHDRSKKTASDVEILNMATDRLKDAVAASLRMVDVGQNYTGIPAWMEQGHLIEATAERRTSKGWEKKKGMVRNESFDHLVQARAVHIWIKGEKINWASPPIWAVEGPSNSFAVLMDGASGPSPAPMRHQTPVRKKPAAGIKYLRR